MIEEAFKVFKSSRKDLKSAASDPEVMCSPSDLFNLLGKIEDQEDQEWAIFFGVWNLFEGKRTECLDPLLNALESNESFNHLKDAAIKQAFKRGSYHGDKSIVERFYDHPAVTSKEYADGLLNSGRYDTQKPIFTLLLGEADQDDLNAVKKHWDYKSESKEFKKVIEDALLTAKPGGDRFDRQRAKFMMEIFNDDSSMSIPAVISQLISSYLHDGSILKPRTTPIKKTIDTKGIQPGKSDNQNSCIIP